MKKLINREKLEKMGYANAAIEAMEFGHSFTYWNHESEEAKILDEKYKPLSLTITEYPEGTRYLYGSKDITKIDSDLLEELPKAER